MKSSKGELMLVEVQNESQTDYFQRMVYGASKLVVEYIKQGETYGAIKKVFSINIVYFGLGQGKDYVYEYDGRFVGKHLHDTLLPTTLQQHTFGILEVKDIFPKYYLLKVNNFDNVAKDRLDEWIYFLKNSEVKDNFKAKGLQEAREKLKEEALSEEEKAAYRRFQENRRLERSELETAVNEGIEKGIERVAVNAIVQGKSDILIMELTGLTYEQIAALKKRTLTDKS